MEFIATSILYALTLIAFIVYYLKWNELADFVNSLHVADSNSTESLQESSLNSTEPIALGRGGGHAHMMSAVVGGRGVPQKQM